ncbi:ABC transporter permease subunit [Chitinophaga polysaccharea]|uniref:ABC transporter permease subunit n=1 Tax=Chitinophaga polysaccharea TaxID=1293035 RepID=UPI001157CA35|nr:Gldg family protein [Chitinophaga polysaccharea]
MKITIKIARNELRNLFYSPVAWFTLIVFLIVCAGIFMPLLTSTSQYYWLVAGHNREFEGTHVPLTAYLMRNGQFYEDIAGKLYFFIPLLTMGLVNREVNQGTIRLLYSTPTKLWQIVCGKYLGVSIFNLLLVLIVAIFHGVAIYSIVKVDIGPLLSSLLGFYLLVCAYSAIGLFMSCITNYQVVAAIATFIALFALQKIGGLWQGIDYLRDITWFLSMESRLPDMQKGLLVSKDILYFIMISGMFVVMSYLVLLRGRKQERLPLVIARYIVLIVLVVGLGYVSGRPGLVAYYDTSEQKVNTIHPRTRELLKQLDGQLEVTLYCNLLGLNAPLGVPEARNTYLSQIWEKYQRFKPNIKFNYIYYFQPVNVINPYKTVRQIAQETARLRNAAFSLFKTPAEIKQIINLAPENYQLVMQLKYKNRSVFLRTYQGYNQEDRIPGEVEVAAALNTLIKGRATKVVFITGELERRPDMPGERNYTQLSNIGVREALTNHGFEFTNRNLNKEDIPKDADIVVLADPKIELGPVAQSKLSQYIARGGNTMILSEPNKQDLVNPLLDQVGVKLQPGILAFPNGGGLQDQVNAIYTDTLLTLTEEPWTIEERKVRAHAIRFRRSVPRKGPIFYGATSFSDSSATLGVTAVPLVHMIPGNTWLKAGTFITDSVAPRYDPANGDRKQPLDVLKAFTRKINGHEQRMIVGGDADFMSVLRDDGFGYVLFAWLADGKAPVYLPRPKPLDVFMRITTGQAESLKVILVWIVPAVLALLAAVLLIRRKRR